MDFWLVIMMASCLIHLRESIPSAHEIYELYMIQRLSVLLQRVFHRESVTLDISGGPEIRHRFLVLDLPHIGCAINPARDDPPFNADTLAVITQILPHQKPSDFIVAAKPSSPGSFS
ncbi:hypothetical protein F5882DRAFT_66265 [Hyaloscypha sp. PMI_1271]|nr:hypothetical protein F5882DRAFT_66265 [Hyaloscypha sp. PMI_1271]